MTRLFAVAVAVVAGWVVCGTAAAVVFGRLSRYLDDNPVRVLFDVPDEAHVDLLLHDIEASWDYWEHAASSYQQHPSRKDPR